MKKIVYIDLFSGCGGFALGLKQAGVKFRVHLYSEIDKYKIMVYRRHFPNAVNLGDITNVNPEEIIQRHGNPHLVTFGWPCQDCSSFRKGAGLVRGRRSSLFFQAIRIIDEIQPRYFIAENVARLRSIGDQGKGSDYITAISSMSFLCQGLPQHELEMQLFNSINFTAQSRNRLYFVGQNRNNGNRKAIFPIEKTTKFTCTKYGKPGRRTVGCLVSRYGDSGVTTTDTFVFTGKEFRGLMPVEWERFQGFPERWTEYGITGTGLKKKISNRQRYRMIGDAVTVPIVEEIAAKIIEAGLL